MIINPKDLDIILQPVTARYFTILVEEYAKENKILTYTFE